MTRGVVISATPIELRRAAVALDSTIVELCFMIGPAAAIALATAWSTRGTLIVFAMLTLLGATALTIMNPPFKDQHIAETEALPGERRFSWVTIRVVGILAVVFIAGWILAGTDIGIVAALRDLNKAHLIGVVLAVWGVGSAAASLTYGALHRPIRSPWLLLFLGLTTVPIAFANNPWTLSALLLVAGIFCAPTLTASVDELQSSVAPRFRGQVMGWQGTFMTAGNTLAPPLIGLAIDARGWPFGFLLAGGMGVIAAIALLVVISGRRRRLAQAAVT